MNESGALQNFSDKYFKIEKIDGKIYMMAPPRDEHIDVQGNLYNIFSNYFKQNKKRCRARFDSRTDIDDEGNYVKPDLKVLCSNNFNKDIPVIVIEVLSKSTRARDLGIKMEKYENLGIKEYWIVTWETLSIDIYLLNDDKQYKLYKSYTLLEPDDDISELSEEEQKEFVTEFSPVSFPELIVKLEDVFDIYFA